MTDHELVFKVNGYCQYALVLTISHIFDLLKNPTAPLLTRTKIELLEQQIQTPLINRHNPNGSSIYREPPSPDVDKAWERLHKGDRLFLVGEDEVSRIGKDPDVLIKAPLEWGKWPSYRMEMCRMRLTRKMTRLRRRPVSGSEPRAT